MVETNRLAPVVRTQAHDVSLIRDDVMEFELPKEAEDRIIRFRLRLPRLDRDREMVAFAEVPARDRMCDIGRAPGRDKHIDAPELRKIVRPRLPMLGVVLLGSVVEVAHVVDRELIAFVVGRNAGSQNGDSISELKKYLSGLVPKYMMPSEFRWLDRLPTTSTGKVDRQALTRLAESAPQSGAVEGHVSRK